MWLVVGYCLKNKNLAFTHPRNLDHECDEKEQLVSSLPFQSYLWLCLKIPHAFDFWLCNTTLYLYLKIERKTKDWNMPCQTNDYDIY